MNALCRMAQETQFRLSILKTSTLIVDVYRAKRSFLKWVLREAIGLRVNRKDVVIFYWSMVMILLYRPVYHVWLIRSSWWLICFAICFGCTINYLIDLLSPLVRQMRSVAAWRWHQQWAQSRLRSHRALLLGLLHRPDKQKFHRNLNELMSAYNQ